MATCPKCASQNIVKNGHIHNGKERFKCSDCGRQFVENPTNKLISQSTKDLIDKLLLEKIPRVRIAKVAGVSERWLQKYVKAKYESVPKQVNIQLKKGS
ncbi:hypothetical protein F7734_41110 [Scytonema sp. UIC 10036]|uniref:IS1/IS1595 family N-terminal zinc-binding domain-containing protein n=1 Tax=Scytonema sp. UIC 10036 TaxID=2304196 RepID=UPI0012DAEEEE|nr:IS1 family transposase [Scytonema sp. UIC 10036]MUG98367.1 hypothetical protein [Scytonema sp. UIC 10036]